MHTTADHGVIVRDGQQGQQAGGKSAMDDKVETDETMPGLHGAAGAHSGVPGVQDDLGGPTPR